MKFSRILTGQNLLLLMLPACLLLPVTVLAQDKAKSQVAERLQTKVSVTLGTVTLPAVLDTLSKQTGLTIEAEPFLRERKVVIQLDGVTARTALDALAELHDWTWRDMDANRVLIMRRRVRLPAEAAALPRRIQSIIPKDIRTFLEISLPSDDLRRYVSPIPTFDRIDAKDRVSQRTFALVGEARNLLAASLKPENLDGEPIRWKALSASQKERLLTSVVFAALWHTSFDLLHSDLPPYAANPASASLQVEGGTTLHIRTIVNDGKTRSTMGFGTQVNILGGTEVKP